MNKVEIWNFMVETLSQVDLMSANEKDHEAALVYHFYSEVESGGHEGLLNWLSDYIEKVGSTKYFEDLSQSLEKIGASEYAVNERTYGEQLWKLFKALEADEKMEAAFYEVIQKADGAYYALEGKIGERLETYFSQI